MGGGYDNTEVLVREHGAGWPRSCCSPQAKRRRAEDDRVKNKKKK